MPSILSSGIDCLICANSGDILLVGFQKAKLPADITRLVDMVELSLLSIV